MKTARRYSPTAIIAKYTILDEVRQRSFIVMFVMCVLFVLLMRGCYQGNYVVNGQALDSRMVAGTVSKAAFHVIAVVSMLITALFSMRALRRDRDEGTQSFILSKPITRRQYVLGKVLALWVLSSAFMFVLHAIVAVIVSINLKVAMPSYLGASLLCSLNLFFVVVAVLLLSLLMPEIVAFLCAIGICVVSLVGEGVHALAGSPMVQSMAAQAGEEVQRNLTLGKFICYLWPKIAGMQHFGVSVINSAGIRGFSSFYPLINILVYCLIIAALLLRRFRKEEIV